jgi:hypothetical protein
MREKMFIIINFSFIFLFLISCTDKKLSGQSLNRIVTLNIPLEVDFFRQTKTKIVKIPKEKNKNQIQSNNCNNQISIKNEEKYFIIQLLNLYYRILIKKL